MDQELFARFRKCAVEVLSVDEGKVVPEAKFGDDLDADSLDLVDTQHLDGALAEAGEQLLVHGSVSLMFE